MEAFEFKQYMRAIRKRLWLIALFVLVASLLSSVYSYFMVQPLYQASTKLIVNKSQQENLNSQISLSEINANILLINTYKEVIRTRAIMDKVVQQYPELGLTAEQLMGRIGVSSVNETQVMTLSVIDPSYDRAMNTVNAISKVFQESLPSLMKIDNVTILNQAMPVANPAPINFNPTFNIMVSCLLAFMLSLSLVFLLEYLDDSIKSEQDIHRYLGGLTLGVIHTASEKDLTVKRNNNMKPNVVGEAPYATANQ